MMGNGDSRVDSQAMGGDEVAADVSARPPAGTLSLPPPPPFSPFPDFPDFPDSQVLPDLSNLPGFTEGRNTEIELPPAKTEPTKGRTKPKQKKRTAKAKSQRTAEANASTADAAADFARLKYLPESILEDGAFSNFTLDTQFNSAQADADSLLAILLGTLDKYLAPASVPAVPAPVLLPLSPRPLNPLPASLDAVLDDNPISPLFPLIALAFYLKSLIKNRRIAFQVCEEINNLDDSKLSPLTSWGSNVTIDGGLIVDDSIRRNITIIILRLNHVELIKKLFNAMNFIESTGDEGKQSRVDDVFSSNNKQAIGETLELGDKLPVVLKNNLSDLKDSGFSHSDIINVLCKGGGKQAFAALCAALNPVEGGAGEEAGKTQLLLLEEAGFSHDGIIGVLSNTGGCITFKAICQLVATNRLLKINHLNKSLVAGRVRVLACSASGRIKKIQVLQRLLTEDEFVKHCVDNKCFLSFCNALNKVKFTKVDGEIAALTFKKLKETLGINIYTLKQTDKKEDVVDVSAMLPAGTFSPPPPPALSNLPGLTEGRNTEIAPPPTKEARTEGTTKHNGRKREADAAARPAKRQKRKIGVKPSPIAGLTHVPVQGDGNCLFHAVGFYLNLHAQALRDILVGYLSNDNNFSEFSDFMTSEQRHDYVEKLKNNLWGGQIEIELLQRCFRRPIIVIQDKASPILPDNIATYDVNAEPIFVHYNGVNHYDALLVKEGKSALGILQDIRSWDGAPELLHFSSLRGVDSRGRKKTAKAKSQRTAKAGAYTAKLPGAVGHGADAGVAADFTSPESILEDGAFSNFTLDTQFNSAQADSDSQLAILLGTLDKYLAPAPAVPAPVLLPLSPRPLNPLPASLDAVLDDNPISPLFPLIALAFYLKSNIKNRKIAFQVCEEINNLDDSKLSPLTSWGSNVTIDGGLIVDDSIRRNITIIILRLNHVELIKKLFNAMNFIESTGDEGKQSRVDDVFSSNNKQAIGETLELGDKLPVVLKNNLSDLKDSGFSHSDIINVLCKGGGKQAFAALCESP